MTPKEVRRYVLFFLRKWVDFPLVAYLLLTCFMCFFLEIQLGAVFLGRGPPKMASDFSLCPIETTKKEMYPQEKNAPKHLPNMRGHDPVSTCCLWPLTPPASSSFSSALAAAMQASAMARAWLAIAHGEAVGTMAF